MEHTRNQLIDAEAGYLCAQIGPTRMTTTTTKCLMLSSDRVFNCRPTQCDGVRVNLHRPEEAEDNENDVRERERSGCVFFFSFAVQRKYKNIAVVAIEFAGNS